MNYMPLMSSDDNNEMAREGKFTQEGGGQSDYKIHLESLGELYKLLD